MTGRLDAIDALRGFALFGVVISNLVVFAGASQTAGLDLRVAELFTYAVTGKFLGLFALLFGVSFALFIGPLAERPERSTAGYLRRLLVLFGIGTVHRVLCGADILMDYAVLGLALLLLRRAPGRVLLLVAILGLALPELWRLTAQWLHYVPPPPLISRADRLRLMSEGPYLQLVWVRVQMLPRWWTSFLSQGSVYITPMVLGFWMARSGIFNHLNERRRLLLIGCGVAVALAGIGYLTQNSLRPALAGGSRWTSAAFGIAWTTTTFVQAAGYGAAFLLLWSGSAAARRVLAWLVYPGRMALTNYLSTSLVGTALMAVTGMYGRFGIASVLAVGLAFYLCQVAWSTWWLRRHQAGPAEWLWRRLARTGTA
jgi:uncharacterized protein